MMTSYIIGSRGRGAEIFRDKIPSIFRIQDYIEHAWDMGINANGRLETGGIRGTRKYIGTPEVRLPLSTFSCYAFGSYVSPRRALELTLTSSIGPSAFYRSPDTVSRYAAKP